MQQLTISDLLGRNFRLQKTDNIKSFFYGKKILVTGAGGSIGSEIVRQLSAYKPTSLLSLDRDESALHKLDLSINGSGLLHMDELILADIRDPKAIDEIIGKFKPEIVFHTAALKHVVMLEKYPEEAYKTNVLGTKNLVESCKINKVSLFINISTDKAVKPISILGKTKKEAEEIVYEANFHTDKTQSFITVRFGNVLGSRGSFLDAFNFQIENDLDITLTHKDVKRYFMTIEEAVNLVLQAATIGERGSILYLDMGEAIKIEDVAMKMIKKSGKNLKIKYLGLRKGEKLNELLFDQDLEENILVYPGIFKVIKSKSKI